MSSELTREERDRVLKSFVVGDATATEESRSLAEESKIFDQVGAVPPPYDPRTLCRIFENSSVLRPNVDAYVTNIDANGFHLEASVELTGDDARKIVRDAMYIERLEARDRGKKVADVVPTEDEVTKRISEIEAKMSVERYRTTAFFDACTVDESFTSLRRRTRQDMETAGNGFWEILRDSKGKIAQFVYMPVNTMRLMPQDSKFVDVVVPRRFSPITVVREKMKRRFRRFVQLSNMVAGSVVYFKELGDPRVMSAKTGKYYKTDLEMKNKEGVTARTATEILHFKIPASGTPYGVPRWIGALLSILGTRHAEEVNFLYFENKSVPPLALLVSGGQITANSVERIKSYLENNIKGKTNFHKVLVIEAESPSDGADNNGRLKLELKPLTSAQQSDALFQKYDERNADKVGIMFRLPRMLRGDVRDFNRATADAALEFAEMQVFGPERSEFDFMMNRFVLADIDVRFWAFASNAAQVRDPKAIAEIIAKLMSANVLVPADGRALAGELVFNRKLPEIDADWIFQPPMLTQVGIPFDTRGRDRFIPRNGDVDPPNGPDMTADGFVAEATKAGRVNFTRSYGGKTPGELDLAVLARDIVALRDALLAAEEAEAKKRFVESGVEKDADGVDEEPETITLSLQTFIEEFGITPNKAA